MRPEEIVVIVTGTTTWSRNEMETGGATMKSIGKQRLGPGRTCVSYVKYKKYI